MTTRSSDCTEQSECSSTLMLVVRRGIVCSYRTTDGGRKDPYSNQLVSNAEITE